MMNAQSVFSTKNREQIIAGQAYSRLGTKTLSEYQRQAILPEVDGIAARVLTALQNRIGNSSLAIAHLASDLNLSKRTLQRRLQQEEVNFAQLRDKLRFNHAISYLVEQKLTIDSISSNLDFSDRTSFTNAFKRWTELSPSLFRKLYRDDI